ncbi:hypothetical protein PTKIN_Ptkin08bG0079500 [Pterospermum kingtungense]
MATHHYRNHDGMLKGQSTNRPPLFDGTNYTYKSTRIGYYIRSIDLDLWDIMKRGPFVLTKPVDGLQVPKIRKEFTTTDKAWVQLNDKPITILHCVLNIIEVNRIITCTTANQIWDKLQNDP